MGFANVRAAAWWWLREQLDPTFDAVLALPPDDLLTGDLASPRFSLTSGGKLLVEPKDEIRRRLGRSPDSGDSVVMAVFDAARGQGAIFMEFLRAQVAAQAARPAPTDPRLRALPSFEKSGERTACRCLPGQRRFRDGMCMNCQGRRPEVGG